MSSGTAAARKACALACVVLAVLLPNASPPALGAGRPPLLGASGRTVDLQLVLAADVSRSMNDDMRQLQRQGYAAAFRSPALKAVLSQPGGPGIAVAYVEWAGAGDQVVLLPWTLLDGPPAAERLASAIEAAPSRQGARTSISAALDLSLALFGTSPFRSERKVIDISGDGRSNEGPPVALSREHVIAQGVVINGLPILNRTAGFRSPDLDLYYETCVIGGPGAFIERASDIEDFGRAILAKLVREIANLSDGIPVRSAHQFAAFDNADCGASEGYPGGVKHDTPGPAQPARPAAGKAAAD